MEQKEIEFFGRYSGVCSHCGNWHTELLEVTVDGENQGAYCTECIHYWEQGAE